jgi:flavin reductase (DIM6/NTAB) family NADH-FMN oxidoreductase RutF
VITKGLETENQLLIMKIELNKVYRLLSPRLVFLITTANSMGGVNAAPVDFTAPVTMSPPVVMVSIKPDTKTYQNIVHSREFVMNVLSKGFIDRVLRCAKRYQNGVNKLEQVGLHSFSSQLIDAPRVKEAKVWIECRMIEEKKFSDRVAIFAEALIAEVKDDVLTESEVDTTKLNPIVHLAQDRFLTDFKVSKHKRYD